MHRYRIIAQVYLILSILNLVLAAPVVVQRIQAPGDDPDLKMGPAEEAIAMPNESGELEAASDRLAPTHSSLNAMASPQHSNSP
jgi:hypothetical protein